jgi:hypothetical protein
MVVSLLSACAGQPKALMTLEDKSLSVNTYQLLLTRMKGTVANYGYNAANDNFWRTIISSDGTTYDDYFTVSTQEQASRYLIGDYLFDYCNLELTDEDIAPVDTLMDAYVKQAGSKNNLNATLKSYGANYDILRDLLLLDVKVNAVKEHLYGNRCEKVDLAVKEKHLNENYVAYAQIFVSTYSYIIKTDEFKDTVYYTDESCTAIAYDTEIGLPMADEFGKPILDEFQNVRLFDEDGKVAYDKVSGVVGYETEKDKDGNTVKKTAKMSDDEIAEVEKKVNAYLAKCDGDIDAFYEHAEIYGEGENDGEIMYLRSSGTYYGSAGNQFDYLDEIALAVKEGDLNSCSSVESPYGFHIVCKLEMTPGVYDDENQKDVFGDFYSSLSAKLFDEKCKEYEALIEIDEDVLASMPKISEVEINKLY